MSKFKIVALLLLFSGFFIAGGANSCGDKKEDKKEQVDKKVEHKDSNEHPTDSSEHPNN